LPVWEKCEQVEEHVLLWSRMLLCMLPLLHLQYGSAAAVLLAVCYQLIKCLNKLAYQAYACPGLSLTSHVCMQDPAVNKTMLLHLQYLLAT